MIKFTRKDMKEIKVLVQDINSLLEKLSDILYPEFHTNFNKIDITLTPARNEFYNNKLFFPAQINVTVKENLI